MGYNKFNYNGSVLLDLTGDDVTQADVLAGKQFTANDGEHYLGSMPERGAVSGTIASKAGAYTIQAGHHNGSGTVQISPAEQAKIIPANIKHGVSILGETGTYNGDGVVLQTKSANFTPTAAVQTLAVTPDAGADGLGEVDITVAAIPYREEANAYGTTVIIG
ncbi:MAG: hypothetical protein IJJ34_04695 [Clostridia bacterium]|nr:hypothetical protein [Clostridia bacterium]